MATARFKQLPGKAKPKAGGLGVPWGSTATTGTYNRGAPGVSAPAAPGAQARPVDPFLEAAQGSANRQLSTTLQGLQYQRGQLGSEFGLGVTPQGTVFDDPSNPYSRAAALQLAHDRSVQGTTTSMAAQGQLYSGATQNAQNENQRVTGQNRDSLIRQFLGEQNRIKDAELQAQNAYQDRLTDANSSSLERALAARPDAASVPQAPAPVFNVSVRAPVKAKPKPKPKKR